MKEHDPVLRLHLDPTDPDRGWLQEECWLCGHTWPRWRAKRSDEPGVDGWRAMTPEEIQAEWLAAVDEAFMAIDPRDVPFMADLGRDAKRPPAADRGSQGSGDGAPAP